MKSIVGIGPVIAAGLMCHIDIEKAPTVGHIWRFAGLDPTTIWEKKQKRPWNAKLKTLTWKISESFVKTCNHADSFYGPLYQERKVKEQANNDAGLYADQAKAKLEKFKIGKDTEAYGYYSKGFLPPAHIHARAKRWTVKLFLSHLDFVDHNLRYGVDPPKPYILTPQGGHAHEIKAPNWPLKWPVIVRAPYAKSEPANCEGTMGDERATNLECAEMAERFTHDPPPSHAFGGHQSAGASQIAREYHVGRASHSIRGHQGI